MQSSLGAHCDDFQTSCRLCLKLDLSLERETVLHFFDRARREHPNLKRFRRRNDGAMILEEGDLDTPEGAPRRWLRLEPTSVRFGYAAPPSESLWRSFGRSLLEYAPYYLSLNDLDIDYLEIVYSFDLEYSGNHDQLVADTLLAGHPLAGILAVDDQSHVIDYQPYFGIALSPDCDLQAYLEVRSRTNTFEIRTGEYEAHVLSVYLTVRQYWGSQGESELSRAFLHLTRQADELAQQRVVPLIVNPLALAIASRP